MGYSESSSRGNKGRCGTGYALRLLDRVMGADKVFVRLYQGVRIKEPAEEREKRVILWGEMADSLKLSKHLLEGVAELDVKALWVKVCTSAQPNPRELMVTYLRELMQCKKTTSCGFAA